MLLESRSIDEDDGTVDVIAVRGAFDASAGRRASQRIIDLAGQGRRAFVIDLSTAEVTALDALTPVLGACARLEPSGGRISVVLDSELRIFTIPGREALYDVAVTRDDAVERIRRP